MAQTYIVDTHGATSNVSCFNIWYQPDSRSFNIWCPTEHLCHEINLTIPSSKVFNFYFFKMIQGDNLVPPVLGLIATTLFKTS